MIRFNEVHYTSRGETMSSIERPLSGDVLVHDLRSEREQAGDPSILERSGRNARTLIKSGPLRVTVVVLAAGGEIPEHSAEGPITIQPVTGSISFTALGRTYELGEGELLSAGPRIPHSVASEGGGTFLLTVAHPEESTGGSSF
ncbi:MAG TPA: cupin domain-containing protein [Thermoanaerobaculia bacterium]|nr:cupin domain-containing protein [Thermoanaerobaculia bacterium]